MVIGAFVAAPYLIRKVKIFDPDSAWHGYADAKPSESVFDLSLPAMAVAVVFPFKPNEDHLEPPVKQYKDESGAKKTARAADELANWLTKQQKEGLKMRGFIHCHSQASVAELGMNLIEELPSTRVEPHYDSYRLYFGSEHLDFGQAIALGYYFLTMSCGIAIAGKGMAKKGRKLLLLMDRFPGVESGEEQPGDPSPPAQGEKFLDYFLTQSTTGRGLEENNRLAGIDHRFGALKWWKKKTESVMKKGKTHPHFLLPDWLAAANIAESHPNEMAATFGKKAASKRAVEALRRLNTVFRSFSLVSIDEGLLQRLRCEEKVWNIPDEIREDVVHRATQSA